MSTATQGDIACARIARRLAAKVGAHRYSMWFDRSARIEGADEAGPLVVVAANRFVAEWIGRNFREDLEAAAREETGRELSLDIRVEPESFKLHVPAPAQPAAPAPASAASRSRHPHASLGATEPALGLRYTLDDFIVGPSNQLAYSAAYRLVDEEDNAAHPLFIHGGVGLGKTHLLQGVCRRIQDRNPNARIHYTTGEQFTNEFLTAVRSNKLEAFRRRVRRLDLLAVDDVHFLADKEKTQQEFLHSLNAMELGGARLVLASDCHPKLIHRFSEALVSRCVRGMVVEIKPPDTATRVKIISALARRRGLTLMESVAATLAARCNGSVRDIEGELSLLKVMADMDRNLVAGRPLTHPSAEAPSPSVIGHTLVNRLLTVRDTAAAAGRPVTIDRIIDVVCEALALTREELVRRGRQKPVVLARSLAVCLARQVTSMSYPEIAQALGRASHSTVITADRRMRQMIADQTTIVLPATLEEIPAGELIQRLKSDAGKA